MQFELAAALSLTLLLTGADLARRRRKNIKFEFNVFVKSVLIALGVGVGFAQVLLPSVVFAYIVVTHPGPLTAAELGKLDLNGVAIASVVGTLVSVAWAVNEYVERTHIP